MEEVEDRHGNGNGNGRGKEKSALEKKKNMGFSGRGLRLWWWEDGGDFSVGSCGGGLILILYCVQNGTRTCRSHTSFNFG